VRLDESKAAALADLNRRLKDEAELLTSLQQKAMQQLETNNRRERGELEQKNEIRYQLLSHKVT